LVVVQPVPSVNGQHAQTHALPVVVTTVVELVACTPPSTSACVPGSPEPWSPEVSCHGSGPSSKVVLMGEATRSVVPGGTHTVVELVLPGLLLGTMAVPFTESVHHVR
jgi:hypothetical protein